MSTDKIGRAIGALVGLATGDALGVALHGVVRDLQPRLTAMRECQHVEAAGDWTYLTSTTLALGRTVADMGKFDASAIMHALLGWYDTGHYVPGKPGYEHVSEAVMDSLRSFKKYNRVSASGSAGADASALVRTAPIAIACKANLQVCISMAKAQCELTHNNPMCVELCAVTAEAIHAAIYHKTGKERTLAFYDSLSGKLGQWRERERRHMHSSQFVVHVAKCALWAIDSTNTFEDALILAVNLGEASTMIGALTGQLAGAIYGVESIPPRWIDKVAWREFIMDTAIDLYKVAL